MNTVICFYPGAGGHRYKNLLTNKEYTTANKVYDGIDPDLFQIRQLTDNTPQVDCNNRILLTHCMNYNLVKQKIPNSKVIKIVSDFKPSLMRAWSLFFKDLSKDRFHSELDNAYSAIVWHTEYYGQYPADMLADELVYLSGNDKFAVTMQNELAIRNNAFEQAWDIYMKFGKDAPIIDLERELNNVKK